MEVFSIAKAVRLRSHLDSYLVADDDQETVRQSRNGSSRIARWLVEATGHVIRLKSCHGRYLTASHDPFLLGVAGKRVTQTVPGTVSNSLIEWQPTWDGFQVKLRARSGQYLRANGGTPPWRNSITHDHPSGIMTRDWVLWTWKLWRCRSVSRFLTADQRWRGPSPFSPLVLFKGIIYLSSLSRLFRIGLCQGLFLR
ncbi:hypothetical protein CK203_049019 [Vitis vinifera]|uniref:DUF569 domain-containing protein n=1 Tax=Vitis vinifera TaxID=29760 RepID=A0A438HD76_VITVI|nr:hypothetical protein CK203_049019 [Vitis vinifera]